MVMERRFLPMGTSMKVHMRMVNRMVLDITNGQKVAYIKVSLQMVYAMAKGNGIENEEMKWIYIRANMQTIENVVEVCLNGQMVHSMKVSFMMIREMDMEKYIG
jgi:2-phospho-L-lactate guanylyltransferase (CobY/MobA/RfbA family)